MKYIYHHLGLGDHIICNGIVRHYNEIFKSVTVFCKPHNFTNVEYMYRDNGSIIILPIGEDSDIVEYVNKICIYLNVSTRSKHWMNLMCLILIIVFY